jgi:serine/threonine protein kinase
LDFVKQQTVSEIDAKFIFKQLHSALQHCHKKGVIHFDIKLENILINPSSKKVKFIDFGLCGFESKDNQGVFCRRTGSAEYWPIEMLRQELIPFIGKKVDIFCLGIVLYVLLNGTFPFDYNVCI